MTRQTSGSGAALGICIALSAFYPTQTPWTTLWDRDEAWFAQAAVEMVDSGRYLVPTFNGELWAAKPVLVYWLMPLTARLLGVTELAARSWSPVAGGAAAWFTFAIDCRLFSARVGLLTMLIVAANPLVMVEGVAATCDEVLLASVTAAIAAFLRMRDGRSVGSAGRVLSLAVPLAAGQLAKGQPLELVALARDSAR